MFAYEEPLYRPPSEARSLIVQVTIGCAHNTCTFCRMYKGKKFRIRPEAVVTAELDAIADSPYRDYFYRMFLADGDALCVPTDYLLRLLRKVRERFPEIQRVTSYATAADILRKTPEELAALRAAGLRMVYLGVESGDEEILRAVHKDCTPQEYVRAAERLRQAGIENSVTLISGLGGKDKLERHADATARLISEMKPEYCAFLMLRFYEGTPLYEDVVSGRFHRLSDREALQEMKRFLERVDSEGTVFRANHASNYIPLAGRLNGDTPRLLAAIDRALSEGYRRAFREYGDV